ncbi:hypothetical protein ACSBR2_031310 [Camellia fascicularis]
MLRQNIGPGGSEDGYIKEKERLLPIANVGRIMKQILFANAKISKEAKETMQECVSEFISFVTSEASEKCKKERRKTVNGDDVCWALGTLGFDDYAGPLKRSFADVVKAGAKGHGGNEGYTIQVNEEGHGWLYDSVLLKFKSEFSMQRIAMVLKEKGLGHVLVRNGGGRTAILTFSSKEDMLLQFLLIKEWFKEWCESVKLWEPGVYAEQERCLRLRCYGVPLSMWNRNTFNKIGSI